jgi:thiamine biosynthesis lipoprotein
MEAIEAAHRQLSRFEASSLVSHLHRVAAQMEVSLDRPTFDLLADACAVRAASAGAFDPTLGTGGAGGGIILDPERATVRLTRPGVRLDLGGIAKGHAIELAAGVLAEAGIESAFLHGGGSSGMAMGRPPGGPGWRVALGDEPGAPVPTLVDAAFSVSATRHRANGRAAGQAHLVDPATGLTLDSVRSAAVVGPGARLADAWATALCVPGAGSRGPGPGWQAWQRQDAGWRRLWFPNPETPDP